MVIRPPDIAAELAALGPDRAEPVSELSPENENENADDKVNSSATGVTQSLMLLDYQ